MTRRFVYFYFFCGNKQTVYYSIFKMSEINKFWNKIRKSLDKNSILEGDCVKFMGWQENGYGVKQVTWPDGSKYRERAHRVSYMLEHRLLHSQVPRLDVNGFDLLDVSHICHNKLCIKPSHLVLESHLTNVSRHYCVLVQSCIGQHDPPCLFWRTS